MNFVLKQMQDGVAKPLRNRYENLKKVNKEYLFAGINIAWENGMNQIPRLDKLPTAAEPIQSRGIQMQVWESGAQLGYASLHWNGYNNSRLIREAILARITPKQMFTTLMWEIISDYNILLSKTISDVGVPRTHIFTHQVAIPTVDKSKASALWPPVWVNVNDFSTPGFTMDNRGSAVFDIDTIKQQIKQVDKNQKYYAAVETYLQHYHDESSLTQNLKETFESGAIVKWLYGAYPVGGEFGLDVDPVNATLAIKKWLLNK
ncbi:hypothetical protein AKO1_002554 [Acrasis kona]|uniref:Uncharacterized protein n=1 Tax=Acrasis kona TaxID=1008807 RepID=A0AAW2ZNJ4_9EUKA